MTGIGIGSRLRVPVGMIGRYRMAPAVARLVPAPNPGLPRGSVAARAVIGSSRYPQAGRVPATGNGKSAAFDDMIRKAAQREGVDEKLVKAVVEAESGFNPRAVSKAGAKGLMQLMDGTARSLGVRDSFDPASNLAGGAKFLRSMLDRFGSVPLALAAYNAGPGAVEKYGGIPPYQETRSYVERVLSLQKRNQLVASGNPGDGGIDGERTIA